MLYGKVPGIKKRISRLVQGTVMVNSKRMTKSFELLDEVFSMGCTTFDTARSYNNGDTERVLGRWLRERGLQEEVVIISKGAHHSQERKRVTPQDIAADLEDTLSSLGLDTIDLFLLHRDDPSVSVGPIVEALNQHIDAGRIRAYGGSNWTYQRIQEANAYALARDMVPLVASSPQYSLAEQLQEPWPDCVSIGGPDAELSREWYRRTQLPLFAWSSLAGGFFSGRFRRDNLDSFDMHWDKLCVASYASERNFQRLERAQHLARRKGLTLPQVALAYVLNQPLNLFAIVGCFSGGEFADNVQALNVTLTAKELAWLDLHDEKEGNLTP